MATITDIKKLRPELLDMSVAELERRRSEIEMAIAEKAKVEAEEKRRKDMEEATKRIDQLMDDLRWLHERNFLGPKVIEAFSGNDGQFAPHRYLKRPRVKDHADQAA